MLEELAEHAEGLNDGCLPFHRRSNGYLEGSSQLPDRAQRREIDRVDTIEEVVASCLDVGVRCNRFLDDDRAPAVLRLIDMWVATSLAAQVAPRNR